MRSLLFASSIFFSFIILLLVNDCDSKLIIGKVDTTDDFFYIGKFTYSNKGEGSFEISTSNMEPESEIGSITVNLYNNDPSKPYYWPSIWNNESLTCEQKYDLQYPLFKGNATVWNDDTLSFIVKDDNIWTWYFVLSDCKMQSSITMDISLEWKNPGGGWYEQFSVEDQDLLTIYLVFFIVWLIFFPTFLFCIFYFFLKKAYDLDYNLKLFCAILMANFVSIFMYTLHYTVYAFDGVGIPGIMIASDVLMSLSTMCFFVFLSQIVTFKTSNFMQQNIVIFSTISCLLLLYLGFFFWQEIYPGLSPQSLSYRWETIPGAILMTIQCIFWLLFVGLGVWTLYFCDNQSNRRPYLITIIVIFSIWYLVLPFSAAIDAAIPYYDRWKTILSITLSFNLFAYIALCVFIFPNRISRALNAPPFAKSRYNEHILAPKMFDDSESSPYGSL